MISIEQIENFYPASMRGNTGFQKHFLKEYVQLLVLDFLSTTPHVRKMTFIGGTNLRLVKGIDRFSEDLDFDCKNLGGEEFGGMSDDVLVFLLNRGKGRDYYDVMFLLAQTPPDYRFLSARCGIHDVPELKAAVEASLQSVDLAQKRKDFEHLLFHRDNSRRILHFRDFIQSLP